MSRLAPGSAAEARYGLLMLVYALEQPSSYSLEESIVVEKDAAFLTVFQKRPVVVTYVCHAPLVATLACPARLAIGFPTLTMSLLCHSEMTQRCDARSHSMSTKDFEAKEVVCRNTRRKASISGSGRQ